MNDPLVKFNKEWGWFYKNYSVTKRIWQFVKNMLLLKKPQFLPNHNEALPKWGIHEYLILAKFRYDWAKIVDFLIKAYF